MTVRMRTSSLQRQDKHHLRVSTQRLQQRYGAEHNKAPEPNEGRHQDCHQQQLKQSVAETNHRTDYGPR